MNNDALLKRHFFSVILGALIIVAPLATSHAQQQKSDDTASVSSRQKADNQNKTSPHSAVAHKNEPAGNKKGKTRCSTPTCFLAHAGGYY